MPITGLPSWVEREKVKPSKMNLYKSLLEAKFNAGIVAADISPTAAIQGGQISTAGGQRITTNNIEDGAVTGDKLKKDPTAGAAAAGVNDLQHVKDGLITAIKIASATLGRDRMKISSTSVALSGVTPIGQFLNYEFPFAPSLDSGTVTPLCLWLQHATDVPHANPGAKLRSEIIEEGTTLKLQVWVYNGGVGSFDLAGTTAKLVYLTNAS